MKAPFQPTCGSARTVLYSGLPARGKEGSPGHHGRLTGWLEFSSFRPCILNGIRK